MKFKIDFEDKFGHIFETIIITAFESCFELRGWSKHHRTLVVTDHRTGVITHIIPIFKRDSDMDYTVTPIK